MRWPESNKKSTQKSTQNLKSTQKSTQKRKSTQKSTKKRTQKSYFEKIVLEKVLKKVPFSKKDF